MWSVVPARLFFQCEWADGHGLVFVDVEKRVKEAPPSTRSAIKAMCSVVRARLVDALMRDGL